MQGRLFGSQYRTAALKSSWIDFFSLPAGASHGRFLTSLHYIGFVCTSEWSCSLVTDLKRLVTTNSCRNSFFAQDIKMCGLEPKNQTGKVKHNEVDEKTRTRFSGTSNSPFLLGADRCVQLGLGFGVFFQLIAPRSDCAALQHLHTAGSGVKPELTSQRGLVSPAIPTLFCSELHAGQHCLRNEKNIWSHNCSCGLHGAELRQLFTAKCTRTMLLLVLLLEFSITIPKCVKTKIIQVFTLLYWLFQSDVHQCLHNYLSEIIQQTPFKPQDCTSGWAVHIICTVKNSVEGSRDLC